MPKKNKHGIRVRQLILSERKRRDHSRFAPQYQERPRVRTDHNELLSTLVSAAKEDAAYTTGRFSGTGPQEPTKPSKKRMSRRVTPYALINRAREAIGRWSNNARV